MIWGMGCGGEGLCKVEWSECRTGDDGVVWVRVAWGYGWG